MSPEPGSRSSSAARALRVAVGLVLLGVIVKVVGPRGLARALAGADPWLLVLAVVTYGAVVLVKTGRWRLISRMQGYHLPFREALGAYGLGMLLGAVTPGRVGQHAKAVAAVRRGATWERAVAGTVVDQLLDFLLVAALVPFAVGWFGASLAGSAVWGLAALALAALGLAAGWFLVRDRLSPALAEAWALGRTVLGIPLLLAAVSTLLYFATLGVAGRAVGIGVGTVTLALASVASAVVEIAPVTVAGLGTREAALLALLGPLGVEPTAIVAFTLVVRALQVAHGAAAWALGRTMPGVLSGSIPTSP